MKWVTHFTLLKIFIDTCEFLPSLSVITYFESPRGGKFILELNDFEKIYFRSLIQHKEKGLVLLIILLIKRRFQYHRMESQVTISNPKNYELLLFHTKKYLLAGVNFCQKIYQTDIDISVTTLLKLSGNVSLLSYSERVLHPEKQLKMFSWKFHFTVAKMLSIKSFMEYQRPILIIPEW